MAIDGNVLDSFFVALGFQTDPKGIDQFEKASEKLRGFALRLGAALSVPALGLFVKEVAQGIAEVQHFAESVHLSYTEVAAWSRIAEESLVPPDAMQASLKRLAIVSQQAYQGISLGKTIFKQLGLSARHADGSMKGLSETMFGLIEYIGKHPDTGQGILRRLRLDSRLLPLLEKGPIAIKKMLAEAAAANPVSNEQADRAKELTEQFAKAKNVIKDFTTVIALQLMPTVQRVLDKFMDWYRVMTKTELYKKGLQALRQVADELGSAFTRVANALSPVAKWLGDNTPVWAMKDALYVLIGVVGALAVAFGWMAITEIAALWPLYLIGAAVVATGAAFYLWWGMMKKSLVAWGQAWDWILDKIATVIEFTEHAWAKTKKFFGGDDSHTMKVVRESVNSAAITHSHAPPDLNYTPPSWNAPEGRANAWGAQSVSHSRATTFVHHVSGTTINISSPDPAKAGEAVQKVLRPVKTRTLIRNSQSGTVL